MGKGSGSCDERAPVIVGEGEKTVPAVDLSSAYHADGALAQQCYSKIMHTLPPNLYSNNWEVVGQYVTTQLRRHGKGVYDNTPTERQFALATDPTIFILLDQMILEEKQQLSKHLGVRADALKNWAEQKQAEADDAAAEAAAVQAQYEYAKSIGQ